jgi:hypothetical protein
MNELIKILFKSKEEFFNWLFQDETDIEELCFQIEPRGQLAPELGITFKGLYEITGNEDDDGEWAGVEHYDEDIDAHVPEEFPCIMVWTAEKNKYDTSYTLDYVYLKDFI